MFRSLRAVLLALAVTAVSAAAQAQTDGMPSDIEWRIAELGDVVDVPETAKLYEPLQEKEPYSGVEVTRDVKYGPDERNSLDVFVPTGGSRDARRPVLIYVHGGGFIAGTKHAPGSPFYDNVMLFAVRNGLAGVNMTYRLAPANKWPSGAEDVRAAVRWVHANLDRLGGDPARVFLMGHSAGAVHVASYVAHTQFHGPKSGSGLAGAILVSGIYDINKSTAAPDYFGADESAYAAMSPLPGLAATRTPLLIATAEFDPPMFLDQAARLDAALCKAGRCGRLVQLAKHSHMSEVYAINTPDKTLTDRILAFIAAPK
jgi:triacylglycerol lipase